MGEFTIFILKAVAFVLAAAIAGLLAIYAVVYIASWLQELKHNVKRLARKRAQLDVAKKAQAEMDAAAEAVPKAKPRTAVAAENPLSKLNMADLRKLLEEGSAEEAASAAKLLEARRKLLYQLKRFDDAAKDKPSSQRHSRQEQSQSSSTPKSASPSSGEERSMGPPPDTDDVPFDPPYAAH